MPKYYRYRDTFEYSLNGDMSSESKPFVITMSGGEGISKPGYHDNAILDDRWIVVAVKRRNLYLEKNLWELKEFLEMLLSRYQVLNSKFVLHGHSNGAGGMLRFACRYPELCCGLVLVACTRLPISRANISKLHLIPVVQHYDPRDPHKSSFGPANVRLARRLRDHHPWAEETKWKGHGVEAIRHGQGRHKVISQIERMLFTSSVSRPSSTSSKDGPKSKRDRKRVPGDAWTPDAKRLKSVQHFSGLNCYNGHGGTNMPYDKAAHDRAARARGYLSVEDAIALCRRTAGAVAFTYQARTGFVWLLTHVDPHQGVLSKEYDVYRI